MLFLSSFWNSATSEARAAISRISKRLFKRFKRKPKDSPYLLSPLELRRLRELLSAQGFLPSYQRFIEALVDAELGALLGAGDATATQVALGRLKLLDTLYTWPERLAALNQEHYDDRAKRERDTAAGNDADAFHLGSPYWRNASTGQHDSSARRDR